MSAQSSGESDGESDGSIHNQVVARSDIGTAFYLFSHQAGGHKPFLRSALGEVCKPAIPLELQFYQSLDSRYPQLKSFVPPFVGVITVDLHPLMPVENATNKPLAGGAAAAAASTAPDSDPSGSQDGDEDDTAGATTTTDLVDSHMMSELQLQSPTKSPTVHGKKRWLGDRHGAETSASPSASSPSLSSSASSPCGPTRAFISTASYSAKLWQKERSSAQSRCPTAAAQPPLPRSSGTASASLSREYLVLGDLTQQYSRPCVLDIKMGTRQHGEDAPPAKARSHSAKCAATTSLSLGLRICGMQVYDEVEQRYILWDKHWGRQLQEADIEPALTTYLSNGSGLHRESLQSLREKLLDLQRVVARTTGVRFWGASLLLLYEGDLRHAARREDVHLIDFAHCQMSDALGSPDEGLLLGLANMIKCLTGILVATATTGSGSPSGAT